MVRESAIVGFAVIRETRMRISWSDFSRLLVATSRPNGHCEFSHDHNVWNSIWVVWRYRKYFSPIWNQNIFFNKNCTRKFCNNAWKFNFVTHFLLVLCMNHSFFLFYWINKAKINFHIFIVKFFDIMTHLSLQ